MWPYGNGFPLGLKVTCGDDAQDRNEEQIFAKKIIPGRKTEAVRCWGQPEDTEERGRSMAYLRGPGTCSGREESGT